jgi:RHS repeat-associated protein
VSSQPQLVSGDCVGEYTDPTGLIYLRARYYDPATGQFVTADPMVDTTRQPYAYAAGDPVNAVDPTGADPCSAGGGGGCYHDGTDPAEVSTPRAHHSKSKHWWNNSVLQSFNPVHYYQSEVNYYENGGSYWGAVGIGSMGGVTAAMDVSGVGDIYALSARATAGVAARVAARAGARDAAEGGETELVQRAMSRAELQATEDTGLVRGGREGTSYVSDNVNSNALRARQRLALPQTPELRVTLEVPRGAFSPPKLVDPRYGMPGGGMERMGTGQIACRVVAILDYC